MGKQAFSSGSRDKSGDPGKDGWVDLEMQMREEDNRHPGVDELPVEERPIIDPRTGVQAINPVSGKPRSRRVKQSASLGFDSTEFHYAGDRIVTLAEEVEIKGGKPTGKITHVFQRFDDQGKSLGTYAQDWERVSETRHQSAGKARRYYSLGGGK